MAQTTDDAKYMTAQEIGIVETQESYTELLNTTRIIPENAIVVPKAVGDVFEKRFKRVQKLYKDFHEDWKQSIKAFETEGSINDVKKHGYAKENFIRWMVQTLQDYTYMQNPTATFTATETSQKPFADALEATITALVNKASGMGVNLRPYILKMILYSYLTNHAVLKLEYVPNEGSREDALKLYTKAQEKLREAQDADTVEEYMSLMDRLYKELQNRDDFGIRLKIVSPFHFFVDPEAKMNDFSDAKFTFEIDFIEEEMLQTRFMSYDPEEDTWRFKYDDRITYTSQAKASDKLSDATLKEGIIDSIMPDATEDERSVKLDGTVECIWVHDRTTRMVYLYIAGDWGTPLWVFEDDMELSRFFPYFKLSFSPSLRGLQTNSEVSYIKGFQDEINETNKQWKLLRAVGFTTFVYNADEIDKKEVDKMFKEALTRDTELKGIGVKIKDRDTALDRVIKPMLMPTAQAQPLLDNDKYVPAIERASRISAAMRGNEFKTNTTNQAVQTYQDQLSARTNAFVDPIEECVAEIMWALAEIVVSKVPKESLTSLVSSDIVQNIKTLSVTQFNQQFSMIVEAGSTEKPNSINKKNEAVKVIQMLGQFGSTAPRTVLGIVTRMLRNVFDRNMVTNEDLDRLEEEGMAYMQKGISTQGGQTQQPAKEPQQ